MSKPTLQYTKRYTGAARRQRDSITRTRPQRKAHTADKSSNSLRSPAHPLHLPCLALPTQLRPSNPPPPPAQPATPRSLPPRVGAGVRERGRRAPSRHSPSDRAVGRRGVSSRGSLAMSEADEGCGGDGMRRGGIARWVVVWAIGWCRSGGRRAGDVVDREAGGDRGRGECALEDKVDFGRIEGGKWFTSRVPNAS